MVHSSLSAIFVFLLGAGSSGLPVFNSTPSQNAPLQVPSGWVRTAENIYELRNPPEVLQQMKALLDGGHQPWRLVPSNVAADCLHTFGIQADQDVFALSAQLHEVHPGSVFQFSQNGQVYTVHLDIQSKIPIAVKLVAAKRPVQTPNP